MNLDKILLELKDGFGLKNQHIEILKALQFGALSAEKICEQTTIPVGRIYAFLNELLSFSLIQKTNKKPYVYWMEHPKENILHFMKSKFDIFVKNEHKVMKLLEEKEQIKQVEHVDTSNTFMFTYMKMLGQCENIHAVAISNSLPFEFYAHDKEDFLKLRDLIIMTRPTLAHRTKESSLMAFKTIQDFFAKKKSYTVILEKKTLDFHKKLIIDELGSEFYKKVVGDLRKRMAENNLRMFVIDEHNPMQLFVSDDRVFFSLRHHGATSGVLLRSKDIANLYMNLFNGVLQRAKPIEGFL